MYNIICKQKGGYLYLDHYDTPMPEKPNSNLDKNDPDYMIAASRIKNWQSSKKTSRVHADNVKELKNALIVHCRYNGTLKNALEKGIACDVLKYRILPKNFCDVGHSNCQSPEFCTLSDCRSIKIMALKPVEDQEAAQEEMINIINQMYMDYIKGPYIYNTHEHIMAQIKKQFTITRNK